jgi:hypothetical protein
MQAPQIIIIVLIAISLVVNLLRNGESRKFSFVSALFDSAIVVGVLIWGGFFS